MSTKILLASILVIMAIALIGFVERVFPENPKNDITLWCKTNSKSIGTACALVAIYIFYSTEEAVLTTISTDTSIPSAPPMTETMSAGIETPTSGSVSQ
jgi:hypothetical protein